MQPIQYVAGPMPAWKAHVALLVIATLPLFVYVPPNLNVIVTAALAVYVGCWRSVKTQVSTEAMTKKDAMRFPIVGSCVLFGLFLTFKFLPKDIVNMLLGLYFVVLGIFAITASMLPFLEHICPPSIRDFKFPPVMIPYLLEEPMELDAPQAVGVAVGLVVCSWYFFKKSWFANNVMGLAFSITGIEHLSLGSMHVGCILLSGLFFYDIFWVFCTPVMVSVAKSFDAPIKLLFPRGMAVPGEKRQMGMLGLGDIVIPGIFVALVLRYDYRHAFKSSYFQTAFWGYTAGLGATIVVMNYFQAAQPALLYIVPAVLGSVFLHAALKGEFKKVFDYSEQEHAAASDASKQEGKQE